MKAFEGMKLNWLLVSLVVLSVGLPAIAQKALPAPPVPPPLPPKAVSRNPIQRNPSAPIQPDLSAATVRPAPAVVPALPAGRAQIDPVGPVTSAVAPLSPFATADPNAIKWDAETKDYTPKPGESEAKYSFWLTNVSSSEILINSVRTSCGCTVAKLPSQPWHIAPGEGGPIEVTLSLAGKSGLITKGVTVDTSVGIKQLIVKANLPAGSAPGSLPVQASGTMGDTERLKNMQQALADRQVVFKNADCAKCHADPAKGKTDGRILYAAVCATCHNSHLRAAAVPELRTLPHPTNADYWRQWITHGRAGSMMPAFAESEGGPLNEQQISALVDFMVKAFPSRVSSLK